MKLNPYEVATKVVVEDNPDRWLEQAVRIWEAEVHQAGWDQPPRMGVVVLVPDPGGLGVGQLPIPENVMAHPDILLEQMVKQHPGALRRLFMPAQWRAAGWKPMGVALTVESWAIEPTPINLRLFRTNLAQHPNRVERRRTLLAGPQQGQSFTLVRMRGGEPYLDKGIAGDYRGEDAPEDTSLEDHLRTVARMIVPRKLGGDAPD